MKKITAFLILSIILSAPAAFAAEGFPLTVAGITLGKNINDYANCCDMKLANPMPDAPFLTEAHIRSDFVPGIRGGSLAYGNCDAKGKLVRIKLKFHDRSQKLFNSLLKKYTKAFGKPDSYQGDAFKNVIAWEWNFNQGEELVTVLLMWSRDKEIRPGVSIKMTLTSLLDNEYACFNKKNRRIEKSKGGPSEIESLNDFVPR